MHDIKFQLVRSQKIQGIVAAVGEREFARPVQYAESCVPHNFRRGVHFVLRSRVAGNVLQAGLVIVERMRVLRLPRLSQRRESNEY